MSVETDWTADFKDRSGSHYKKKRQQPLLEQNDAKCQRTKDFRCDLKSDMQNI